MIVTILKRDNTTVDQTIVFGQLMVGKRFTKVVLESAHEAGALIRDPKVAEWWMRHIAKNMRKPYDIPN